MMGIPYPLDLIQVQFMFASDNAKTIFLLVRCLIKVSIGAGKIWK